MTKFICKHCCKDKKTKYNHNTHLYLSNNKCSMKQQKEDNESLMKKKEEEYETNMEEMRINIESKIKEIKETFDVKLKQVQTEYETKILSYEAMIKDKEFSLKIALRESDYHINSKDEQIIKLENHIKEMTTSLINKPTNQYNLHVTKTAEEYMGTKKGIYLNVLQCLKPKESKKIELIILNGEYDNFETYDYYTLLCSLIGQNFLLENIIVKDQIRGKVLIRYNNKTEEMSRTKKPFETSYELGKINDYIKDKVSPRYRKHIKSNEFYINKLRLSLVKYQDNNRLWGDIKENMVLSCNTK